MSTEVVAKLNDPLRESVARLMSAVTDLVELSHEMSTDFKHTKKIKSKMEDIGVGSNIIDSINDVLSGQKTLAGDFERMHQDCMSTFMLANELWSDIQMSATVEEYNDRISEWNTKMGSEVVSGLGEIAKILATNSKKLASMIHYLSPVQYATYHLPDISSNVHDLVSRSDKVPAIASRVSANLNAFNDFLSGKATTLALAEPDEFTPAIPSPLSDASMRHHVVEVAATLAGALIESGSAMSKINALLLGESGTMFPAEVTNVADEQLVVRLNSMAERDLPIFMSQVRDNNMQLAVGTFHRLASYLPWLQGVEAGANSNSRIVAPLCDTEDVDVSAKAQELYTYFGVLKYKLSVVVDLMTELISSNGNKKQLAGG